MEYIKLYLCGDVMIGRSFNKLFKNKPNYNIWGDTINIIKNGNFFGINLETTITEYNEKFPDKVFNFKLLPEYSKILKKGGVTYANIANNHILDYKEKGLTDTISILDKLQIQHSGAGIITDSMRPAIFKINNVTIGIVSASDHPEEFKANNNRKGINFMNINAIDKWNQYINSIIKVRPQVDILIFSMHHGYNYVDNIPENTIKFFHKLIDSGVDIIHGHSAHHVLPIDHYKNGYIFYSMGDFIDDYVVDKYYRNDLSFLAEINIVNKIIDNIKIYPTKITITVNDNDILTPQVNLLDKSDPDYKLVITRTNYNAMNGGNNWKKKYMKYKKKINNLNY
ncbi:MAG: hypothetical protein Edafosvirus9_36 [Edafosvirus sp.]|uniref:Capsule synthesis protein CapA domain-containing protein n=1 Tax=Edafosvirus sp. TaxID=2487765 RepID=A0A3G4ZTU9_9VIRU|nr:MAG: hypothetical protein Edafosvirus9_36 [Edafosvirus sp.]